MILNHLDAKRFKLLSCKHPKRANSFKHSQQPLKTFTTKRHSLETKLIHKYSSQDNIEEISTHKHHIKPSIRGEGENDRVRYYMKGKQHKSEGKYRAKNSKAKKAWSVFGKQIQKQYK
jgi:hypothetical protein